MRCNLSLAATNTRTISIDESCAVCLSNLMFTKRESIDKHFNSKPFKFNYNRSRKFTDKIYFVCAAAVAMRQLAIKHEIMVNLQPTAMWWFDVATVHATGALLLIDLTCALFAVMDTQTHS